MTNRTRADQKLRALREKGTRPSVAGHLELPQIKGVDPVSAAIRYLPGGRDTFVEAVKLAADNGDPASTAWWSVYAELGQHDRERCNFGEVGLAAGVKPSALLAGVVGHNVETQHDVATLMKAIFESRVVSAMVESASKIDGEHADISFQDRVQFLQGTHFLPTPKGAQIYLSANANAESNAQAAAADPALPTFADDIASMVGSRNEVHRQITERGGLPSDIDMATVPERVE